MLFLLRMPDSFVSNANVINENDKAICGTNPAAPPDRAVEVMISTATLNGWVDGGYSDPEGYGYTKMVMLHVDSCCQLWCRSCPGRLFS